MLSSKKTKIFSFFVLAFFFVSSTAIQFCSSPQKAQPITLTYWRPFSDKSDFDALIAAYKKIKPNVTITYQKLTYAEYEDKLLTGFSLDKGPDMFAIHNDWLPKYKQYVAPMPAKFMSLTQYKNTFADVATKDFVDSSGIYGIPLSIDTLALYYNKDHFDQANIASPPKTWKEFTDDVLQLTKMDSTGSNILRSGAAIGTGENINRSMDILSLLMLQNNTQMTDDARTKATFDNPLQTQEGNTSYPGRDALQFYTDFASASKEAYTWNPQMDYSLDAFAQGNASMMINYSFQAQRVRDIGHDLNFDVAPAPQVEGAIEHDQKVNFANYWGEVVSSKSQHQQEAWEFLQFISSKENLASYLKTTKEPTSRRDMINDQKNDPDIGVFASQVLTAKSWYKPDATQADNIFVDMIKSVNLGTAKVDEAIQTAVQRMDQLFGTSGTTSTTTSATQ